MADTNQKPEFNIPQNEITRYFANYDKTNGKLLGWYNDKVHETIPEPNMEVTEEQWQDALNHNYNYVDVANKKLGMKDFKTLAEHQQIKKNYIERAYKQAIQKPITYNKHVYQADQRSQDVLSQIIAVAPSDFKINWLDIDNNVVNLTLDDLRVCAQLILTRGQTEFAKKTALKKQVDQATTISDVEKITWE